MTPRVLVVPTLLLLLSCRQPTDCCGPESWYNQPPVTWIAAGPPEGATVTSPVHFYWGGWDEDGAVVGYEYLMLQDSTGSFAPRDTVGLLWSHVMANDSTFAIPPDSAASRTFTFLVHAVDDQGLRSREAPHRTFHVVER